MKTEKKSGPKGTGSSFRSLSWGAVPKMSAPALDASGLVPVETDPYLKAFLKSGLSAPTVLGDPSVVEEYHVLLRAVAEVEQALMVQYLYSFFSAENATVTNDAFHPVAIQEMGHLFSVQNVLRTLGYDTHLELPSTEDPEAENAYPFPFVLQPAGIPSLAQFTTAESPLKEMLNEPLKSQAIQAEVDAVIQVNHVGILYLKLYWMTQPSNDPFGPLQLSPRWAEVFGDRHLPDPLLTDTSKQRSWSNGWDVSMSSPDYLAESSGKVPLFVGQLRNDAITIREQICRLFYAISTQGEGAMTDDGVESHFELFIKLYTTWKRDGIPGGIINAATNPWIGEPSPDASMESRRITDPEGIVLAQAFNLRYERILLLIALTFTEEAAATLMPLIRRQAVSSEMRSHTANLARALMARPLRAGGPSGGVMAGPPFQTANEIPATFSAIRARLEEIRAICEKLKTEHPGIPEIDGLDLTVDQTLLDALPAIQKNTVPMKYKIYPPIGIARLGGHDQFFIAPETPGGVPQEYGPDGTLQVLTSYKDAAKKRIKKQATRFHLFESADGVDYRPATLPAGSVVTWTVRLVNKKSAVIRPSSPPIAPIRPQLQNNPQGLLIDGGAKTISGANAVSSKFVDQFDSLGANGQAYSVAVELGQLRTDGEGNLIVTGGNGFSSAAPNTSLGGSYYRNPGWHDDVADGPVTAVVALPDGTRVEAEGGAWVIIGPPDFAPAINGIVTLYDVIREVGIEHHQAPETAHVSFDRDIAPLIARTRKLQWVHDHPNWTNPKLASPDLRDTGLQFTPLRREVQRIILNAEDILQGHTSPSGPPFRLRQWQKNILQRWVDGDFDGSAIGAASSLTAEGLTRAALDGAVGQGFCPGIEAGIIMLDPTLYRTPFDFRIDHSSVTAGDLTALMAQPWQADFLKCNTDWWPTQRPDLAPQSNGTSKDWFRGVQGQHVGMVRDSQRLGVIIQQASSEVFLESERDPTLPLP